MSCRLRSYDSTPPGGFPYQQTGLKPRNFQSLPMIEAQARIVSDYRKANGLPNNTYAECLVDVDRYNAQRLGCNPAFTISINSSQPLEIAINANSAGLVPCKGCGAPIPQ